MLKLLRLVFLTSGLYAADADRVAIRSARG